MEKATPKSEGRLIRWWNALKAEFNKIIWLNKKTVIKQTVIVLVVTLIVAILITIIDRIVQGGLGIILTK